MPELPAEKQARFVSDYKLSDYDASVLVADKYAASYFEAVVTEGADAKLAANWVTGDLAAKLNTSETPITDSPVSAEQLAGLIKRISDNTISNKIGKQAFECLWNQEFENVDAAIEAKGWKQVSDTGAIEQMIADVIAANPAQVENYKNEQDKNKRKKMSGFFVGQIMKASKGQANPAIVNQLLAKALNS